MVGQRIKAYLEENGIKITFLSEKSNISYPVLAAILAGTRKLDVMEYYRICQALRVDLMTFIADGDSEV